MQEFLPLPIPCPDTLISVTKELYYCDKMREKDRREGRGPYTYKAILWEVIFF